MTIARRAAIYAALCSALAVIAMALIAALPGTPAWAATPGGLASTAPEPVPPPVPTPAPAPENSGTPGLAKLVGTRAVPPPDAPPAVRKVIAAANKIRTRPYVYGGGHGRWNDRGYDCSGAVSFALHGGSLIGVPMPSGSLMGWGSAGLGRWITVYANGGHAYAVIAGLRWDTSGTGGQGPRWHSDMRSATGFTARHPVGY
jgi:cell wall-associated NlpC family hydrolase